MYTRCIVIALTALTGIQSAYPAGPQITRVPVTVSGGFEPQLAAPFRMDLDDLSITVVSTEQPSLLKLTTNSGFAAEVALPDVFEQAYYAKLTETSLVLFGWMNPLLAANVLVLDPKTGSLIDDFWCYEPSLSPNGRSIAFLKFFPSHFAYGVESQYRVYIVDKLPLVNRIGESSISKIEVGKPIYPVDYSEATRDNINVSNAIAHFKRSNFFWSTDSTHLAFIDERSKQLFLVSVAFNSQGEPQGATHLLLPEIRNLCMKGSPRNGCRPLSLDEVKLEFEAGGVSAFLTHGESRLFTFWGRLQFSQK